MRYAIEQTIHVATDHREWGADHEPTCTRFDELMHAAGRRRARSRQPVRTRRPETPGEAYERRRARCHTAHARTKAALRELDAAIAAGERRCDTLEERLATFGRSTRALRHRLG
jgi:hypothetical protein